MRGAQLDVNSWWHVPGIIPACAGSTYPKCFGRSRRGDHPRMCGEHDKLDYKELVQQGSSPHVRGAPYGRCMRGLATGIIPACAGSTRSVSAGVTSRWDHPRMCGEHPIIGGFVGFEQGSSPHVRGALQSSRMAMMVIGIIPACAGSTPRTTSRSGSARDHPRMCGEHTSKIA